MFGLFRMPGGVPEEPVFNSPWGGRILNYLCAGHKSFFTHIDKPMRGGALVQQGGAPGK